MPYMNFLEIFASDIKEPEEQVARVDQILREKSDINSNYQYYARMISQKVLIPKTFENMTDKERADFLSYAVKHCNGNEECLKYPILLVNIALQAHRIEITNALAQLKDAIYIAFERNDEKLDQNTRLANERFVADLDKRNNQLSAEIEAEIAKLAEIETKQDDSFKRGGGGYKAQPRL